MGHVPPYGVIKISQNCLYLLSSDEHTTYIFEAYLFLKHYIYIGSILKTNIYHQFG